MAELSEIVDRHIVAINPDASVKAARQLAQNSRVSMLPVVSDGMLVGLIEVSSLSQHSDDDLVRGVMLKPVFVEEMGSVEDARKLIIEHGLSRLPVVDSSKNMRCIGTISSSDLI